MTFHHLWQLSYDSKTIDILRNSHHAIPIIQALHLFAITLLLGAMVILNLRMLGIGMREISLAVLAKQVWSWGTWALILAVVSGLLVFIPDPARYAANYSFLSKMALLVVAILFQYTLYRRAVQAEAASSEPQHHYGIATLSLCLWFGVAWAGRGIAFLG